MEKLLKKSEKGLLNKEILSKSYTRFQVGYIIHVYIYSFYVIKLIGLRTKYKHRSVGFTGFRNKHRYFGMLSHCSCSAGRAGKLLVKWTEILNLWYNQFSSLAALCKILRAYADRILWIEYQSIYNP